MRPKDLKTRLSYLRYDIHTRTDLFRKGRRCRRFLYRAFGNHPEYGMESERIDQYIAEAEHGDHPWKDFFNVPWRPWAIDWAMLAMDYTLWLKCTEEDEAKRESELSRQAEQYYAYTGIDPREED